LFTPLYHHPTSFAIVAIHYAERPIKIEIVVDPARPAVVAQSLASRVAPAPVATPAPVVAHAPRTGGPRGKRGGKAGGRREGGKQPPKSAADLDAEMEDYTAGNAPAAA